jgi:hypothetical protein
MQSRSPRWTGVASVILPNSRRRRIGGRRVFSALRWRRRGRGRSACSYQRCAIATEAERSFASTRGVPSTSLQAPHSAKASCGCDVRNSGSVSAGSPRLSITARMSAAALSTRCRQRQQSAYSVPCACRALNAEVPRVHDDVRYRAAVRPQWNRLRRTARASQTGRAARRGPTRCIRHIAFDASKLSRARLFRRVARQSWRKDVRIRLMFWVNRK